MSLTGSDSNVAKTLRSRSAHSADTTRRRLPPRSPRREEKARERGPSGRANSTKLTPYLLSELLRLVALERPDVAVADIRMPPTHTDEGLVAAREIRLRHPPIGVLVLSQYVE